MVIRVVIDESGDSGITKVRGVDGNSTGASPYLTLGAVIYRTEREDEIAAALKATADLIGKETIHCNKLTHEQKIATIQRMILHKFLSFGVISNKSTLREYKDKIESNNQRYYNKCNQYLLEQVGLIASQYEIGSNKIEIFFEDAGYDYDRLKNFIRTCQRRPLDHRAQYLQNVDCDKIYVVKKAELPTLQLADIVAHALYRCVNQSDNNYGVIETRYLEELRTSFFAGDKSKILNYGIKCIHNISDLKLQPSVKEYLNLLTNEKAPLD
jgi:hypothetical protein